MSQNVPAVVEKKESPVETIRGLLIKSKGQLEIASQRYLNADRALRTAMTAVQRTPKLQECHPFTLIGAVIQSCQLGLEPGGGAGESWLVPFFNKRKDRYEVQMIPDYRGLIKIAKRNPDVRDVIPRIVYENDVFDFSYGANPVLIHKPTMDAKRGNIKAYYCVCTYKDGSTMFRVMFPDEIQKIKNRSKAQNDGPWQTDPEWMGMKTTVRQVCKVIPGKDNDMLPKAVELEEKGSLGLPQDLGMLADASETPTKEGETPAPPAPKRASDAKKEEARPRDESIFKTATLEFASRAKTKDGDKTVHVLRFVGTDEKFYTEHDGVAALAEASGKEKSRVLVAWEPLDGKNIIVELTRVTA